VSHTPARVEVMGLSFDAASHDATVAAIVSSAARAEGGRLLTANLDHLRRFVDEQAARPYFERADLVVADGMPIIWATRIAGRALPERVAGSDLVWSISSAAAERGLPVFLLGGAPGAARRAEEKLVERFPQLDVCGVYVPPYGFERDPEAAERIVAAIDEARPRVVLVGLPFPMADRLILKLRSRFPDVWFLALGVSLSFVSGDVARAPRWIQRTGLEWLFRLTQEPRLFSRYVRYGAPFALRLAFWALRTRLSAR
jgi:N-acetylglucosaminyldiphosphoundecaprenol N-acetyl-beta-D-mannosaminyltransferase